jgi:transposase-like protein
MATRAEQRAARTPARGGALAAGHKCRRPNLRWTEQEDRTLLAEWSEVSVKTLRKKIPGRSWAGIVARAHKLGLHVGRMQGWETLRQAAARVGMPDITLARLLRRNGVAGTLCRTTNDDRTRRFYYDPEAVDAAVARDVCEMEIPGAAARQRGIALVVMSKWLREAGVLAAPRPGDKRHKRVPTTVIEAVLSAHGWQPGGESIRAAARRHGISPERMRRRLVSAGIAIETPVHGGRVYLSPSAVDAAVRGNLAVAA